MTKPVVGKVVQNIASDNAHACYTNEKLFDEAFADFYDGDGDNSRGLKIMSELRGRNFEMFVINERLASGDVTEAETAAMNLAASNQHTDK